jgi:hypothetical protein
VIAQISILVGKPARHNAKENAELVEVAVAKEKLAAAQLAAADWQLLLLPQAENLSSDHLSQVATAASDALVVQQNPACCCTSCQWLPLPAVLL